MKNWELIKETPSCRFYKLDFRIKNIYGSAKTIKELWKADPVTLKEGYKLAEDISESINKICVSDALTHTERLVFPAFNVRNVETGGITVVQRLNYIDGKHTFMSLGGCNDAVYPDEVYIRHLRMINRADNPELLEE